MFEFLRASLSHITSSSIYLVIYCKQVWRFTCQDQNCDVAVVCFAMASFWNMYELPFFNVIFRLSYLQYSYRFAIAFVEIYLEYLSFTFEWNRYSLMGRLILVKYP